MTYSFIPVYLQYVSFLLRETFLKSKGIKITRVYSVLRGNESSEKNIKGASILHSSRLNKGIYYL